MIWTVEFYTDARGDSPLDDFLRSLPERDEARIAQTIELLREFGLQLGRPYVKSLTAKLWELRVSTRGRAYRIIYFAHTGRRFVLLHGFVKKTRKTPKRELDVARRRLTDYLERHREE